MGMTYSEAQRELARFPNGRGWLRVDGGLLVSVTVTDVRQVFGRTDLRVSAEGGTSAWVASERVRPAESEGQ